MKQIITLILVFIALSASAQKQPSQKTDTTNYFLAGKMQDFQLMFNAVQSPGDVTPNQKERVLNFIRSLRALPPLTDSTKTDHSKPKAK